MRASRAISTAVGGSFFLILLLGLALAGCLPPLPPEVLAPTQTIEAAHARLRPGFLDVYDVPFGWKGNFLTSPPRVAGGISGAIEFRQRTDTRSWNFFDQAIILFPDAAASHAGFQQLAQEGFPSEASALYTKPPEIILPSKADELVAGCLPSSINGERFLMCRTIARYGEYVTEVHANIVDFGGVSLSQLGEMLLHIDSKMNALQAS